MSLKFKPRKKIWENYNGTNTFDPETMTAYSYDWWLYLERVNGKLIFNNHYYSNATVKHQIQLKAVLAHLGIPVDLWISTREGLQNHCAVAIEMEETLEAACRRIEKKGTRRSTNHKRLIQAFKLLNTLRSFRKITGTKIQDRARWVKTQKRFKALMKRSVNEDWGGAAIKAETKRKEKRQAKQEQLERRWRAREMEEKRQEKIQKRRDEFKVINGNL
jgi:hypothetical protein